MELFAYFLAILSIVITLIFFKFWQKGKYFYVAIFAYLIRFGLIPIFEAYGNKIISAEIPELLLWYEEWIKYTDINGHFAVLFDPFGKVEGPKGGYLYYSMYAGWLIKFTNTNDLIPLRIVTSTLSIYVIYISAKIVNWVYNQELTKIQAFIIVNWPFWILYSVMLGRTMPSVLMPLLCIIATYKLLEKFSFWRLFVILITFWFTTVFRTFYSFFFISTILTHIIYKYFFAVKFKEKLPQKLAFFFFSFLVLYFIIPMFFSIGDIFLIVAEEVAGGDQVDGEATGSSYLMDFFPSSYSDLLYYLPIQGFYFLFSPMIWDVFKAEQLFSSIFALILLFLILRIFFIAKKQNINIRKSKLIILNMIVVSMILGAGVKNAGAAQRWRLPVTILLLCVAIQNPQKINYVK